MKTFFLKFQVVPKIENKQYELIEGAVAHCWIVDDDAQSAYLKSKFFVSKDDWEIEKCDALPIEVKEEDFLTKDIGLEHFRTAQRDGMAICYIARARDETAITELTILPILIFGINKIIAGKIPVNDFYRHQVNFI